jgi:serine/threonine protein kinase
VDSYVFLDHLRQTGLVSDEQMAELRRRFPLRGPMHALAGALQAEGMLTTYQCKRIVAGQGAGLAMGKYHILDELGRGGFGQVYKARHTVMNRIVAIKVIAPERVRDSRAREWFKRELLTVEQLHHPNIVMAYDADELDGNLYFVMEYVDGPTLHRLVHQKGPLPVAAACEMLRQAGMGLQYAHEKGLVHRDMKPGNLLIPRPSTIAGGLTVPALVKIVDFGLARLQTGTFQTLMVQGDKGLMGTPDYIAPEQARDYHRADIRSDLYSLGCTFYYALTGKRPFVGATVTELLMKHLEAEAEPIAALRSEVPQAVAAILERLMKKKPEDRYQTPADLVAALTPLCSRDAFATDQLWTTPGNDAPETAVSVMPTRLVAHLAFANEASHDSPLATPAPMPTPAGLIDDVEPSTDDEGVTVSSPAQPESMRDPRLDRVSAPVLLPAEVRAKWDQWTALVELLATGSMRVKIKDAAYEQLYKTLVKLVRHPAADATEDQRRVYQRMESIVAPWLSLYTFAQTDPVVIASLWQRCRQLETLLVPAGRSFNFLLWMAFAIIVVLVAALGTQMTHISWLQFDPGWTTWTRFKVWLRANPLMAIAAVSPVMVVLTAFLLTRSGRHR